MTGYSRRTAPVFLGLLLAVSFFIAPLHAAPFAFTAQNEPVPDLLCAFAESQNKGCAVSSQITGTVTGNLEFATPESFFAFLERSKAIVAYVDAGTIHYYARSEMETVVLPLNRVTVAKLSATLREMQAYDARFPLRPVNNGKMLRLSAPPAYVSLVTSLVGDLEGAFAAAKGTRVFRLKHAWAEDIELNFMNASTVIPGVATLIRTITGEGRNLSSTVSGDGGGGAAERLKGKGLSSRTGTQEAAVQRRNAAAAAKSQSGRDGEREGGARILADPRLNAVIIWDDEELLPFYEALIRELDQPVSLVEIRAAVVDVSVERTRELGVSWDVAAPRRGGSGWGAQGGANVGTGDTAVDFASNQGYGLNMTTIYRNGLDVFMAKVRALEDDGDASVLSRPAVLTMDNIQASLEVTNTYYISVAGQEEVDLFDVTYGTILRVTPHVIEDDATGKKSVKLTVHVEDGGSQAPAASSGISYPIVSKTQVNTQAVVGDGQALIVGGHYYETNTKGDSGIPLLKDLPVLGMFFKNQSDGFRKQERLFVISPRIVDPATMRAESFQYAELFDRTMMTPPVEQTERTTGGCARQRRVSREPAAVPDLYAPARPERDPGNAPVTAAPVSMMEGAPSAAPGTGGVTGAP